MSTCFGLLVTVLAVSSCIYAAPMHVFSGSTLVRRYAEAFVTIEDHVDLTQEQTKLMSTALWKHVWYRYTQTKNIEKFSCEACRFLVISIQVLMEESPSQEKIVEGLIAICKAFKIEDTIVCDNVIREFKTEVLYVVAHLGFDPDEICGLVIDDSCGKTYNPWSMWNVSLPNVPKPPVVPPTPPRPDCPTIRILQISDIHFDPLYKAGTNAKCGEPLCCHEVDGIAPPGKPAAGKWGYPGSCDAPLSLIQNMFQHISKSDQFDVIYWTGDLPSHNVWNQTKAEQIQAYKLLTKLFLTYFPNTPIYSALGNHESAPVNSFPPPFITGENSIQWLYNEVEESWSHWLPESTRNTILYGGFYTTLIKPGFRLVSLNMNYCNNQNWWLLLNSTDPAQELQWLVNVLQQAEINQEKVHIIGHIPNGQWDCMKPWSWNYYNIINRYESTVAAQFFGHTHRDEFEVFYDQKQIDRPTNIAYIGPSLTTLPSLYPGYRIYTVNVERGDIGNVLNHETYILNITEANASEDNPKWKLEYKAKEAYGMESLFPRDWDKLVTEMKTNDSLWDKFRTFYVKSSEMGHKPTGSASRNSLLCALKTGRSHDITFCT